MIGVGMQARSEDEPRAGPVQQAEALSAVKTYPGTACMRGLYAL